MRPIFFFAFLALIAAAVVPRYMGQLGGAAAVAPLGAPSAPTAAIADPVSGGSRVVIEPDARGHFRVEGAIDGRRLDFVVDTGASVVTLTESDAARLGFHPASRDFVAQIKTRNVTAVVLPDEALSENLLGLSFLSRLHRFEYRDGRLVLED